MAAPNKVLAAVFVVVVTLSWPGISGQTHHVVGDDRGWGPDLDVGSWLSGRIFSVGDKIWFKHSGIEEEDSIVEVQGLDEFISCNLTNPIRMYTTHVALDKEGVRYFTSGNLHSCKNGLKLPVTVKGPFTSHEPEPTPPYGPFTPDEPEPKPTPPYGPHTPPPPFEPPYPSAATHMNGYDLSSAGWLLLLLILAT